MARHDMSDDMDIAAFGLGYAGAVAAVCRVMGMGLAGFEASLETRLKAIPVYLLADVTIAPGRQRDRPADARPPHARLLPATGPARAEGDPG